MKKLSFSLLFVCVLVVSTKGMSEDLPTSGFVLVKQTQHVAIYDLLSAKVINSTVELVEEEDRVFITGDAVLEMTLKVEGNLCLAKPDEVAYTLNHKGQNKWEFSILAAYETSPYSNTTFGCTTHSRISEILVPIRLSLFEFNVREFKRIYKMKVSSSFGSGSSEKELTITWNKRSGFQTNIK